MATDAQKLRARGIPVRLADTSMYMLRFTFAAIAEIEDRHGSLTTFLDHLNKARSKRFRAVIDGMAAGLADDLEEDKVKELLDPAEVMTYVVAINAAIDQALPVEDGKQAAGKGKGETAGSPGEISSDEPAPSAELALVSSGG